MKIRLTESADRDLLAGYRFYERQSAGIGTYFLDSLFADIDSLMLFAGIHREVEGVHRALSTRFPYAIFYQHGKQEVIVLRVLDCRRDPKWIARELRKTR